MPNRVDITGQKFNRLTVLKATTIRTGAGCISWECRCDCGVKLIVKGTNIRSGNTKSCGCLKLETAKKQMTTHGYSGSRTYVSWNGMLTRCMNPNVREYVKYGGRGIKVCKRWFKFENFLEDMGERPPNTSIDRINPDGNYTKSNCRWATRREQEFTKRRESKPNTGVRKIGKRFEARFDRVHIGMFATLEEAALARKRYKTKMGY